MTRNLGGAIGTATLATIVTKREQFHSNIIGQSVTLFGREEVRDRLAELTNYFMARGVPDPIDARHQAIVALGNTVRAPGSRIGFSDAFAVVAVILLLAAAAVVLTKKPNAASGGGAHLILAATELRDTEGRVRKFNGRRNYVIRSRMEQR